MRIEIVASELRCVSPTDNFLNGSHDEVLIVATTRLNRGRQRVRKLPVSRPYWRTRAGARVARNVVLWSGELAEGSIAEVAITCQEIDGGDSISAALTAARRAAERAVTDPISRVAIRVAHELAAYFGRDDHIGTVSCSATNSGGAMVFRSRAGRGATRVRQNVLSTHHYTLRANGDYKLALTTRVSSD